MKTNNNNNYKQIISKQIELGRQLQLDHPEIVDECRNIKNGIDDIVKRLDIMNQYNLSSEEIAKGVLYRALLGYDGRSSSVVFPKYPGLISERDFLDISLQRKFYRNS